MLGQLDLASLGVALSLVTLSMTLLLFIAAWHAGSDKGLRHWAVGNFAVTIGLLLSVSQDHIHHSLSIVLANGLMTLGRNHVELAGTPGIDLDDQMALRLLSQFRHNLEV
jgi:hypothetical protein